MVSTIPEHDLYLGIERRHELLQRGTWPGAGAIERAARSRAIAQRPGRRLAGM